MYKEKGKISSIHQRRSQAPRHLHPLKFHVLWMMGILMVCVVTVTIYSILYYKKMQTSIIEENNRLYTAQVAKSTLQAYEIYKNICYSVAFNEAIQTFIQETEAQKKYEESLSLETYLNNMANLDSYIVDIAVIGESGNSISLSGAPDSYRSLLDDHPTSFSYLSVGRMNISGISCHILALPVSRLDGNSTYLGVLFLAIDVERFFENGVPTNSDYAPSYFLVKEDTKELIYGDDKLYSEILSASSEDASFELSSREFSYAVNYYTLSSVNFGLYVTLDKSLYVSQASNLAARQLLWMGIIIITCSALLYHFFSPLVRSLNQLTLFMKRISNRDRRAAKEGIQIQQGMFGCEEIENICLSFNNMLKETDELNHKIFQTYTDMYELEMNNRKTEIAFLRSQINPHFLYNTLTSICGMASAGMTDEIITVTGALSRIYRYSITGSEMVTVREELDIVKSYLQIQQMRFEGRFTIRYELTSDSYDCLIPKMVIQPLVENAIVHGLEKKTTPGELLIGSGRNPEHGYLAIWIFDTGVGMSKERLEQIRNSLKVFSRSKSGDADENLRQMDDTNHESIGILNVNSRMTLYFGKEYSLIIDSEEGVGTNVQLRIPYRIKEKEGNLLCTGQL